ncbi:MAG: hypothetical protein ABJA75_00875 [Bradyrhizobium sp.]
MYRRADLSRTLQLVVALFLTSATTGVFAREFRAADTQNTDTQNEDYPNVEVLDGLIDGESLNSDRPIQAIADLRGVRARVRRDPAMAQLIERIRKVE